MRGYLWVINEGGLVTKFYFDKKKGEVREEKASKKDYERSFVIAAYVLRATGDGKGEFGYVKENIVYFMKDGKIFVLVADRSIADSPYIYGFLRKLASKLGNLVDGYAIIDVVEELVKRELFNIPTPLPPVKLPKKNIDAFFK